MTAGGAMAVPIGLSPNGGAGAGLFTDGCGEAVTIADCFREPSAIVEADRAKPQEPISTTAIILEGIGTILTLIFR